MMKVRHMDRPSSVEAPNGHRSFAFEGGWGESAPVAPLQSTAWDVRSESGSRVDAHHKAAPIEQRASRARASWNA